MTSSPLFTYKCPGKMKNIRLEIRLTEYESKQIEQEADRPGMSKSKL